MVSEFNVIKSAKNWEEAIWIAGQPLLGQGKIEKRYIEKIIEEVKETGPYIMIAPFVALPHARPEDGTIKEGISILKTVEDVFVLDNKRYPAKLFVFLSAVDANSHLDLIEQVTSVLLDPVKLEKILASDNEKELRKLFN